MSSIPATPSHDPEYAWELATLYPEQGEWSEEEYLELTDHAKRRIEYTEGRLEFLPMPTEVHEAITQFLFLALYQFVDQRKLGKVYSNGIRLRVRPRKLRLPDVIFLHRDHFHARHNRAWDGADLVMEVVSDSPADRQRDYEQRLIDYAEAQGLGILDYRPRATGGGRPSAYRRSILRAWRIRPRASRHFRAVGRIRRRCGLAPGDAREYS